MRGMQRFVVFVAGMVIWTTAVLAAPPARQKVIIDTDPGADDAMAILLALNAPELDVKALTVVAGNVVVEQGLENALKLVSLAGRCDIPWREAPENRLRRG